MTQRKTLPSLPPPLRIPACAGMTLLLCGSLAGAQAPDPEPLRATAADATPYLRYIGDLEARNGPYAEGLAEQLLGLGLTYQNHGLHWEAIEAFKRGTHLARVNHGLNSARQLPLLENMIENLVTVGDYTTADARQSYLDRIQRKIYGDNSEEMAQAMMRRTTREWRAYHPRTGDAAYLRLVTLSQIYSKIWRNISDREGDHSLDLLTPLNGVLRTQHLILEYNENSRSAGAGSSSDALFKNQSQFVVLHVNTYKRGNEAIGALREIYSYNDGEDSLNTIGTLVQVGDWNLLHGRRGAAVDSYRAAWRKLGEQEDADTARQRFFGQPVLLPDLSGLPGDIPPPKDVKGYAEVSFHVSSRGRVRNLELLSWENEENRKPIKLMRELKSKVFRPAMVAGKPVETETMRKRYAY